MNIKSDPLISLYIFVKDWVDLNQEVLQNERVTDYEKIVYLNFRINVLRNELNKQENK